jgi:hypothetical protein
VWSTNEGIVEKPNGSVGNGNDAVVDCRECFGEGKVPTSSSKKKKAVEGYDIAEFRYLGICFMRTNDFY